MINIYLQYSIDELSTHLITTGFSIRYDLFWFKKIGKLL